MFIAKLNYKYEIKIKVEALCFATTDALCRLIRFSFGTYASLEHLIEFYTYVCM